MTQLGKLHAKLLAGSLTGIGFRDFERLLLAHGFSLARQSGSHRAYVHPRCARPLIVQPRGAEAKPYQLRQFLAMVAEYRLSMDG